MIRAAKTRPVRRVQDMALESTKYAPNPNRGRIIGDVDSSGNVVRLAQSEAKYVTNSNSGASAANYSSGSGRAGIGGTSITAIAQEMTVSKTHSNSGSAEVSWQNCKCKVTAGADRYLCRKFNIVCVKEKCPTKFIDV
jgi:hypothetical protein